MSDNLLRITQRQRWWPDFVREHGQIKHAGCSSATLKIKPITTYLLPVELLCGGGLVDAVYNFLKEG